MRKVALMLSTLTASLGVSGVSLAQELGAEGETEMDASADATAGAEPEAAPEETDEDGFGLNVDLEVASAYVWRGLNLWGPDQNSQHLTLFPSVTGSVGGLSFGYWGAYQLTGEGKGANVDAGIGAEQDLWVGYDGSISDELGWSVYFTYYFYPFAEEGSASLPDGKLPMYIEPGAGISYSTAVDLGFNLSWYKGIQDIPDTISHIYLNPSVGKDIPIGDMELGLGFGLGYKIWTGDPNPGSDFNTLDLQVDVGLNIPLGDAYVSPAVHASWTNLPDVGFGDELAYWAGVNVGYDFSF